MSEERRGEALPSRRADRNQLCAKIVSPPSFSLAGKTLWIAGHRGMVGQALLRRLKGEACTPLKEIGLEAGLADTYAWYQAELARGAAA